jgi:proteasome-associated ATPase
MPRHRNRDDSNLQARFDDLVATRSPGMASAALEALRNDLPDQGQALDHLMLGKIFMLHRGLAKTEEIQRELRDELAKLTAPPWTPARVLRVIEEDGRTRALVHGAGGARLVELADAIVPDSLGSGDSVYLGAERNVLVAKASAEISMGGETAFFDRVSAGGRLVLRCRDEEVVVGAARSLDVEGLRPGDELCWDRSALLALERIEARGEDQYVTDEIPDIGPESVGGHESCLQELLGALTSKLVAPELAADYGLSGRRSILLHGPPGCGKTLMARAAASEVARLSGRRCRFFVVKPGEWESPWIGESQANIRRCFESLRRAAEEGMAVLFLDEVEAVGGHRGAAAAHHADKFTAAWLAELDGFAARGDVAIISATNRKDLIDSALMQRLSDLEIRVARPDARSAKRIFEIHLGDEVPVHPNGPLAAGARGEILEAAVSQIYAPNGEGELCTLHFRNGKSRAVHASDLVSGRLIQQICRGACQAAFARQVAGGEVGVRVSDMERAVTQALERLATTLTLRNAHQYLSDLPQDVDVVRVEPRARRVKRRARYLNVA